MAYRNTFFRWLFLYSLTFGLTYVLKLFTYLCPETGQRMWIPSIGDGFSLPLNCTLEAVAFVISIPVLFSSCSIFLTLRLPFAAIFRGDTEGFTTAFDAISNRGEN